MNAIDGAGCHRRAGPPRPARRWSGRALPLSLVVAGGCALHGGDLRRPPLESLPAASPLRSASLEDGDAWLRHHLMYSDYDRALQLATKSPVAPRDRLLRALQEGLLLHRAGEYAKSNERLEWAEAEVEARYTRSVSRAAASLAVNDRMIAYRPASAERAMIPFYRMLNYLALGDREGALVESRKSNALLAALERDRGAWCDEHGMLQYLAGVVQASGGERNDALVSLRQAERAFDSCGAGAAIAAPATLGSDLYQAARAAGLGEVADSIRSRYGLAEDPAAAGGEVVVVIEEGFVAHRAPEAVHVPLFDTEVAGMKEDDSDALMEVAGQVAARLAQNYAGRQRWGTSVDDDPVARIGNALEGGYVLRLAWPVARREPLTPAGLRVLAGGRTASVAIVAELSTAVERDLEAERPVMLTRLIARGLLKYLATRELEEEAEARGGDVASFFAGRLANFAANELERADTRSWSLLPDRIALARVRLPPGEHTIRVECLSPAGDVVRVHEVGPVRVAAGEVRVVSERVWGG